VPAYSLVSAQELFTDARSGLAGNLRRWTPFFICLHCLKPDLAGIKGVDRIPKNKLFLKSDVNEDV
jgi:hypothetical protein